MAVDIQADRTVKSQRGFAKLEAGGNGDGVAIDAAGRIYVASPPGPQVFRPDGNYLGHISTPGRAPASVFRELIRRRFIPTVEEHSGPMTRNIRLHSVFVTMQNQFTRPKLLVKVTKGERSRTNVIS